MQTQNEFQFYYDDDFVENILDTNSLPIEEDEDEDEDECHDIFGKNFYNDDDDDSLLRTTSDFEYLR
ncbi:MAG: hypothetical protein JW795_03355 [Chitinivibrionales bacterium]|nr:hypothetical protein [Chitinivibrionales bacterium]